MQKNYTTPFYNINYEACLGNDDPIKKDNGIMCYARGTVL